LGIIDLRALTRREIACFLSGMIRPVFFACVLSVLMGATVRGAEWKLVWSDEFNQPGRPGAAKWGYEEGYIRNNELQYYTHDRVENARIENGNLVIEARKEIFPIGEGKPPARYTSASLTTEGKASWTYGRIEVRAKLPRGSGMWPAIWTLGDDFRTVGWPRCGEIDIMEFLGRSPQTVHGTIHYGNDGKEVGNGGETPITNPSIDFHTYAVEWWPDRIDFFVDGKKYRTSSLAGTAQDNAFHKPHYLILNLAVGGGWGGTRDNSALPQKYLIDYVRVYQQEPATP
jgi:beta-glucanase (GH16 family)